MNKLRELGEIELVDNELESSPNKYLIVYIDGTTGKVQIFFFVKYSFSCAQ